MGIKMSQVAIIIPTYKPGDYLNKCLDSVEKQTLKKSDYCVYIGLNGPKDDYERLVKACLEKFTFNYKYFYLSNSGVSFARNELIENSTQDYLVFLDDDDQISPNYLENLLSITTSTTMGIANVVNFTRDRKNQFENYIGKSFSELAPKGKSLFQYRKYFSSPWGKMLHRNMIKQTRFDTHLSLGEDGLFMASLSKNIESFEKSSSDTIYYVNVRENSSSRSRSRINKKNEFKRVVYLTSRYLRLLFISGFNKLFISTRVIATLINFKKLFY